jgi:hypothetical protein
MRAIPCIFLLGYVHNHNLPYCPPLHKVVAKDVWDIQEITIW